MSERIRSTAQLRAFLLEAMEGVKSGAVGIEQGHVLVKLAGAVTASVSAEVHATRLMFEAKQVVEPFKFGEMRLGRGEITPNERERLPAPEGGQA